MIGVLRAARLRLLRDDRGITLVELIVAMTLGVLVLAMAGSFLIASQRASATARGVNDSTRSAAAAMNEITRLVRSATDNPVATGDTPQSAFQYASATTVRFFTFVNTADTVTKPVQVQLTLDPARRTITERTWVGAPVSRSDYYSFPLSAGATLTATPTTTRVIASDVVSSVLFAYSDGAAVLGSDVTPVAAAKLAAVRRVTVQVTTGVSRTDPNATTLTNAVNLPNL